MKHQDKSTKNSITEAQLGDLNYKFEQRITEVSSDIDANAVSASISDTFTPHGNQLEQVIQQNDDVRQPIISDELKYQIFERNFGVPYRRKPNDNAIRIFDANIRLGKIPHKVKHNDRPDKMFQQVKIIQKTVVESTDLSKWRGGIGWQHRRHLSSLCSLLNSTIFKYGVPGQIRYVVDEPRYLYLGEKLKHTKVLYSASSGEEPIWMIHTFALNIQQILKSVEFARIPNGCKNNSLNSNFSNKREG